MKLKELKECREKLRKCDELEKWVEILNKANEVLFTFNHAATGSLCIEKPTLPKHIREIFADALKAEIEKLDNE